MRLNFFFVFAILLHSAAAQSKMALPTVGYVYDSATHGIRPIRGISGAALLGDRLDVSFDIDAAAIAPSQDFALVVSAARPLALIRWQTATPFAVVPDALDAPDRMIFSESGAAAILYDSHSGRLQVLTGLPGSPAVHNLPDWGTQTPQAIAVRNDGAAALATPDGVRIIGPDLSSFYLPLPATVAALSFDASNRSLLAATASGDLYLAKNIDAGADIRQIYSGTDQTSGPVAVRFSADASAALTATESGMLASVDLATGTATGFSCACAPSGLESFGRAGLFRLTEMSSTRPVLFFDSSPNRQRVWFVPADQRSAQ